MSISFSGLTSGLDTSSWIESLVSLKRAKVTTLQTQREEIVASKDALNSIKSFFTAFRSTLQKITAGKFGNTANAMDIFSRNIAKSSHPNILTAIVNETAQEGSYQIKVDQLATSTIATSGFYESGTTSTTTQLATMSTKLSSLGVTGGKIKLNGNDVIIQKGASIQDFIDVSALCGIKLQFNTVSGMFNYQGSIDDIEDTDGTGIIEKLHLEEVTEGYKSNVLTYSTGSSTIATGSTLLKDIAGVTIEGEETIQIVDKYGITRDITVDESSTFNSFFADLAEYDIIGSINESGVVTIEGGSDYSDPTGLFTAIGLVSIDEQTFYFSTDKLYYQPADSPTSSLITSETDCLLSELVDEDGNNLGITSGDLSIIDGASSEIIGTINIDASTTTLSDLLNQLETDYDFEVSIDNGCIEFASVNHMKEGVTATGFLTNTGYDNISIINTLQSDPVTVGASTTATATTSTVLSTIDSSITDGTISLTIDGESETIEVSASDKVSDLLYKFKEKGLAAELKDGAIHIFGYQDFEITDDTSGVVVALGLDYNNTNFTGFVASSAPIEETITTTTGGSTLSVAKYATLDTIMSSVGIQAGALCLTKGSENIQIVIDPEKAFSDLNSQVEEYGISFELVDGQLKISSTDGDLVCITNMTTSNITTITGLNGGSTSTITGTEKLYCVNRNTALVTSGVFRYDDINVGKFKVGGQEIIIDEDTTIQDVINQINSSETSNAYASWDDHNAKFILESRITGDYNISIEDDDSNFAEVFGFVDDSNQTISGSQVRGQRAIFYINGVQDDSFSNVLDSSVTKIAGVTINLKAVSSNGEYTTLTIEKDKESLANAVSNLVDSYNTLVENIDKELARENSLVNQSGLKFLKNRIRSLMTSPFTNDGNYERLSTIGISTKAATPGDISTSGISKLSFDENKFIEAFSADSDSVRKLMLGTDTKKGIIWQLEDIVDTAVTSVSGYFSTTNNNYNKQISRIDNRIKKASSGIDIYRERLERKFSAMELLITKMQDQYSSFLSTGF